MRRYRCYRPALGVEAGVLLLGSAEMAQRGDVRPAFGRGERAPGLEQAAWRLRVVLGRAGRCDPLGCWFLEAAEYRDGGEQALGVGVDGGRRMTVSVLPCSTTLPR